MLRLVLGRLYSKALVIPAKLDERIRKIAALVNGGLTGDNLAAGYAIPAAAFRERYSRVAITVRFPNLVTPGGNPHRIAIAPPVPVACSLESVSARYSSGLGEISLRRNYAAPVVLAALTAKRVPSYPGGPTGWISWELEHHPAAPYAIGAGEVVYLDFAYSIIQPSGDVTFVFKIPHEV